MRSLFAFFLLSLLPCAIAVAEDSDPLLKRFREEAPIGWAVLEEMESRMEFKIRVTETVKPTKGEASQKEFDLRCQQRPSGLLVHTSRKEESDFAVAGSTALNDSYLFEIRKTEKNQEGWRLERYQDAKNAEARDWHFVHHRSIIHPLTTFWTPLRPRLLVIIEERGFVPVSAREVGNLVEVRLRWHHVGLKNRVVDVTGTLLLDPERHWAVCKWTCVKGTTEQSWEVEFSDGNVNGYPLIKRIMDSLASVNGTVHMEYHFDSIRKVDAPSSAFRLPA